MNRIAWRRVLPICQLALYLALVLTGEMDKREAAEIRAASHLTEEGENIPACAYQDLYCGPQSRLEKVETLLSAPAAILSMPAMLLLPKTEYSGYIAFGIGIVALWYLVGRVIDVSLRRRSRGDPPWLMNPNLAMCGFIVSAVAGGLGAAYLGLYGAPLDAWVRDLAWPSICAIYFAIKFNQARNSHIPSTPPVTPPS